MAQGEESIGVGFKFRFDREHAENDPRCSGKLSVFSYAFLFGACGGHFQCDSIRVARLKSSRISPGAFLSFQGLSLSLIMPRVL